MGRVIAHARILSALLALAILVLPIHARAEDYPTRAITVVVPFPAGGPSDVVARIVTEHMGRTLGQQLVIENVGGAGGTLGSARVAASSEFTANLVHVNPIIFRPRAETDFALRQLLKK